MLINLVFKDFLLVKKHLLFLFLFTIFLPIYVTSQLNVPNKGFIVFFTLVIMLEYGLYSQVSKIEDSSKGAAFICATPYTRKSFVESKYLFLLIVFMFVVVIQMITSFLVPAVADGITISNIGGTFLAVSITFSILIPLQFKFGFDNIKIILYSFIILTPFIFPTIMRWFESHNFKFSFNLSLPYHAQLWIPYFLAVMIAFISVHLSIHIFSEKDL
ncbi:ABC-2 transporter permease [Rummeliibacillus sp. SL167]|uniref:ABC-2 transporter permease n=1 Tax=Rummeliibacillus sp. SL167 TaxID=2579792 RepID=UPI0011B5D4EE|nr:ABC-2 transporter permease [Rummeliibacillus sp. SL167]